MDKWFVTLYVDDNIHLSTNLLDSFLYAVGAALVVGRCHDGIAAKSLDSLAYAVVVGGDINVVNHFLHLFIYSLDYCFASENGKWFAGETRRSVSCRYNCYEFHNYPILCFDAAKVRIIIEMAKKKEKNS